MTIIAIYSRKSKQTDKGESIQNQIELCKKYALNNFTVDDFLIYEDEGFSGGHIDRPMFKKMIKDAKEKKFQILMCYRLDRMSRNISDFAKTIEFLQSKNISFISLREQFDTSTPMGRAMMYIASVFAQLERETITERIKDNMHQLARTGRWLGGRTPLGFKSKQTIYYDKEGNTKKMYMLTPEDEEIELVKMFFNRFLKLRSLTKLEKWTIEKGYKTRNNNSFDKSALKIILSNPVYVMADKDIYQFFRDANSEISSNKDDFDGMHGLMVFNKNNVRKNANTRNDKSKWVVSVGKHAGVISSEKWIKVQRILEKNRKTAPRTGTSKIGLITTYLRCKNCGSKLRITVIRRKDKMYYYYKCLLKESSRGLECETNNLNGPLADEHIIDVIKNIDYSKKEILGYLLNHKNNSSKQIPDTVKQKIILEKELHSYEKSIENLVNQLSKYNSSKATDYIIKQIEELDIKIKDIKIKISQNELANRSSLELYSCDIDKLIGLALNFYDSVNDLSFEEKKYMVDTLIDSILWDGKTLEVNLKEFKKQ